MTKDSAIKERNNLYQLLKTFSAEEWKEFQKFTASPFFNKGRNYKQLMKILCRNYPEFDSAELSKENLYKKLYPGKQYKENVMYSIFSRLYSIAEEFLYLKEITNDEFICKEKYKLIGYRKKGLFPKVEKIFSDVKNNYHKKQKTFYDYYKQKEYYKELTYYYYTINNRKNIPGPLLNILKYTFYYNLIEFLNFFVSFNSQRGFADSAYKDSFALALFDCIDMNKFITLIKENDDENYALLKIYYLNAVNAGNPGNRETYYEMKELVFKNLNNFDTYLKKYMLNSLAMHCNTKYLEGQKEFLKEAFEIRKKTVEENLFSFNNSQYISLSEFRSTFIDALNVNELEWAVGFSEKYINLIIPEFRESIKYYARARIAYENGNYDDALAFGHKVNINQITFKLDMKNLISKIYFETDSTESLISLLNTYQQLIKNSESGNENLLSRHLNFVNYLKKLLKLRFESKSKTEFEMLKKNISRENVTSKKWLIKMIEEKCY